jgi:two-component system copper resistance phosphate regulon response regulator CusR
MRVLVAEDDSALRAVLARGLQENGYSVDAVADGVTALVHLQTYEYEVAIVDWRMPKKSGIEAVAEARANGVRTPILMLTARDAPGDRIIGLNTGSDDYLIKPFDFGELLARLHALQRRPALTVAPEIECGDLRFDPASRSLRRDGHVVGLTAIETGIIELLLRRAPALVTRRSIALHVWDQEADAVGSNTIDVHIARLRGKLEGSRARIETIRGSGYRLADGP